MEKVEIVMEADKGNGQVKLLVNGHPMPDIFDFEVHFNSRDKTFTFNGQRFKTDKYGQFYVDEETKDTAIEKVNLLNLFDYHILNREYIVRQQKALGWALRNVYMTSMLNAENFIKERGCEIGG